MDVIQIDSRRQVAEEQGVELGDLLVSYLRQLDVEYVFGVPGGAIEPLYNALARSERSGGPRAIIARHETGAAFMADGYAHHTGKLGVCCATTGPGATNLITGVASAYDNHTPMLVITAQTALSTFGRGALQESSCTGINTVGLFEHCTRYNTLVSHAEQFEHKLAAAVMTAFQAPAGPVHLSVPLDVMSSFSSTTEPSFDLSKLLNKPHYVDNEALDALYEELVTARNPILLIGDEASESVGSLLSLAVKLGAQIITTPHGKGLVSPYHPLFKGVIGFAGHESARKALLDPEVDLVIAVGSSLSEFASSGWDQSMLMNNRLVHVESAETNLTRSPMARLHVRGHLESIFENIVERLEHEPRLTICSVDDLVDGKKSSQPAEKGKHFEVMEPEKCKSDATPIKPQRLMAELPKLFPPCTRYMADSGASLAWSIHYLHPFDRRMAGKRDAHDGLYRTCLEFASMGWAIGSAVGAALARPGSPVVCIAGDGSMLMSGQELTVAVQEGLPVVFVVLNDSAYGMVRHGQKLTGAEPVGTELPFVDFSTVANAMGADGYVIQSPEDLLSLDINKICSQGKPTLLDVRIDPEEVPPIGMRTDALKSYGQSEQDCD
ncbi:thiamine pyrophosphate-binding protein [Porticoccus sp. W117]|uniref:thiamine pyrophosphate-binding protein n=1 Tax=Porticoccus sp. W117 TaxID=3054777 RepID=UPI0025980461|nr:thiamine pyrophosphate-binding protein [Porticoccus sp. W117]MDM3872105.1 thiamine pyrophosphate-binding protein [Porticoccus sp. W117]